MLEEVLKGVSIVLYEALCCKIFFDIFLKRKYASLQADIISVALLTGLFLLCAVSTQFGGYYIYRMMAAVASILLFSFIFYSGKWLPRIFLAILFYALLICVDYLGLIFVDRLLDPGVLANNFIQVLLVLLCKTVLFIFVLILDYLWKRNHEICMKSSEWILMISFPVLTVVVIMVMMFSFRENNSAAGYVTVALCMAVMNIILFALLKYVSQREYEYTQLQLLQEKNKEKMQSYYGGREDYYQKKRMLHDYNNQVQCIRGLLQQKKYKEAENYAGKLTQTLLDGCEVVDVNNSVINVVLNQKYRLAKSKGITVSFQINDLSGAWMEEQDMVILLANLLDNAIEACENRKDDPVIRLKLLRENSQILLSVQNPVENTQNMIHDQLSTSKADKANHGIGLKNVQMVLEKYDGMSRIHSEDGWFYFTAMIPDEK